MPTEVSQEQAHILGEYLENSQSITVFSSHNGGNFKLLLVNRRGIGHRLQVCNKPSHVVRVTVGREVTNVSEPIIPNDFTVLHDKGDLLFFSE